MNTISGKASGISASIAMSVIIETSLGARVCIVASFAATVVANIVTNGLPFLPYGGGVAV